ncbi:MAG TPA: 4Fe-4S binding protein [Gemmataceae bacterium]|nr:4Fe-4S binding protein [Gemmataceae bacterium]
MTGTSIKSNLWGAMLLIAAVLGSSGALALGEEPKAGETVTQYLTPAILEMIFPGADKVGEVGGTPPAAPVFKGGAQVGFLFSTWDVTQSKGFSNRPLILLVGIDLTGHVAAARLVHYIEPIALLGIKEEQFLGFTEAYKGHDLNEGVDVVSELSSSVLGAIRLSRRPTPGVTRSAKVDAVSRATTSSVLMSDAIVRGGRIVARSRGILSAPNSGKAHLDVDRFAPADWAALEASGAVGHLHLSYGDVRAKMSGRAAGMLGNSAAAAEDVFLDLYVALATPAGIGINLLGETWYAQYTTGRSTNDMLLLIAANGPYSFLGSDWEHADVLDRVQLVQADKTIRLSGRQIRTLPFLHAKKAPDLTERALVFLAGNNDLDPTQPWRVQLLVGSASADGPPSFASFDLAYRVPESYVVKAIAMAPPSGQGGQESVSPEKALAWQAIWSAHSVKITILGLGLTALTVILFLQDSISRRPRLHRWIRVGFLGWSLVWLGWYAGAQLTIVNLLTYIHTAVTDFRWDYLLADPLAAILSAFTLAGLFLWGRAVFCGWLCPFGALQELVNKAARGLRIPQLKIPMALHERLIAVKYLAFLGLVAASFLSWDLAMTGAEIEPFKAAIILRFMTEWPMVVYALALVAASLSIERFYCRFACPLGGGLAIFGRLRMFNWLKRHPECGTRCHLCETVCPVGAIKRSGEINMNECFYCLDCQVTYYDDQICPPMVWRRKRGRPPAVGGLARNAGHGAVNGVPGRSRSKTWPKHQPGV